tara:strand:- start:250 stop:861 length:612 start_codon:yes stop_codon:yes gene_type:complete
MPLNLWVPLAAICLLGAISPGPSLAVVMRHTLIGGRLNGFLTAISHGLGIILWALLTATGIGLFIINNPQLFYVVQLSGALVLLFLGIRSFFADSNSEKKPEMESKQSGSPWRDGFLISITNPKIAIFFLALFSQFVRPNSGWIEKIIMALTAGIIDTLWYALVALIFSHSAILPRLRRNSNLIGKIFGILLVALAIRVVIER